MNLVPGHGTDFHANREIHSMAAPTPKKTKATPKNLEWGGNDKTFATWKTSLLQKVGGKKDEREIPQEFLDATNKVKILKALLKDIVSKGQTYTKQLQGEYSQSHLIIT